MHGCWAGGYRATLSALPLSVGQAEMRPHARTESGARRRSLVSGSAPWMDWWPLTALEQGGACEGTLAPPAHAPGVHKGPALPGSALGASTIAAQKEGSCSRGADIPVRTGSLHKCTSHLEGEGAMGQSRGRGSGGLGSRATSEGAGGISGNGTGVGQSLKAGASWNADGPDWALQEFREALGTGGRKASEVTVKTGFASGSHGELSEDFRGEGNTL